MPAFRISVGIGREALDVRLAVEREHSFQLRAVAEDLRAQIGQRHAFTMVERIQSAASASERTRTSGVTGGPSS